MEDKNRTIYVEMYGPQYSEWTPTHGDPWSVVVSFANEGVDTGEFQWLDSAMEFAMEWVECGEGPILIDGDVLLDGEEWEKKLLDGYGWKAKEE